MTEDDCSTIVLPQCAAFSVCGRHSFPQKCTHFCLQTLKEFESNVSSMMFNKTLKIECRLKITITGRARELPLDVTHLQVMMHFAATRTSRVLPSADEVKHEKELIPAQSFVVVRAPKGYWIAKILTGIREGGITIV